MLDFKRDLRNQFIFTPKSYIYQKEICSTALFALIFFARLSIAGGGVAIQRSVSSRIPVTNFLTLYRKLRTELLSDEFSANFYDTLALRPRRLCGGWNDDSDDHVISLTGAENRQNNRPNAATPHQQIPNQLGVQDISEKVSQMHHSFADPLMRVPTPCATVTPSAIRATSCQHRASGLRPPVGPSPRPPPPRRRRA